MAILINRNNYHINSCDHTQAYQVLSSTVKAMLEWLLYQRIASKMFRSLNRLLQITAGNSHVQLRVNRKQITCNMRTVLYMSKESHLSVDFCVGSFKTIVVF